MAFEPRAAHAEQAESGPERRRRRRWLRSSGFLVLALLWFGTGLWHARRPLPEGVSVEPPWQSVPAADVRLLADITVADGYGRPVVSQEIFDRMLALVAGAREFLVLDFHLFGEGRAAAAAAQPRRRLARELRDALVRRRLENPRLQVLFITDPLNDAYGDDPSPYLEALRAAGVEVVITDLERLPDSNPAWSAVWRPFFGWWAEPAPGDGSSTGSFPNPLDAGPARLSFGAWGRLLSFKANQRRVLIGDDGRGGLVGIVATADPYDANSAHSNLGVRLAGPVLEPLLASELAIARFSGWKGDLPLREPREPGAAGSEREFAAGVHLRARALSGGAIREAILGRIDATVPGDSIDAALFQLADRSVVEALLRASSRGVSVRLILDPADGTGIPNRAVATEIASSSDGAIKVRWYRTHGERFHARLVAVSDSERLWFTVGSADLTRRDLGASALQANVEVEAARGAAISREVLQYFETLWENRAPAGVEYTADFGVFADPAQSRYWLYRVMEGSGVSAF